MTVSATQHAVSQLAIYACPMHPQIRQVAPGSCSICGMSLVEREAAGTNTLKPLAGIIFIGSRIVSAGRPS